MVFFPGVFGVLLLGEVQLVEDGEDPVRPFGGFIQPEMEDGGVFHGHLPGDALLEGDPFPLHQLHGPPLGGVAAVDGEEDGGGAQVAGQLHGNEGDQGVRDVGADDDLSQQAQFPQDLAIEACDAVVDRHGVLIPESGGLPGALPKAGHAGRRRGAAGAPGWPWRCARVRGESFPR